MLVHVADGWAARNFDKLKLAESEEMLADRSYLEETAARLRSDGLSVTAYLALGNPPTELLKAAKTQHCDLIAMTSHGRRLLGDLVFGSTINEVRHKSTRRTFRFWWRGRGASHSRRYSIGISNAKTQRQGNLWPRNGEQKDHGTTGLRDYKTTGLQDHRLAYGPVVL